MIISQEELKELFCEMVKVKKKTWVENCTYPEQHDLDQMLYAGPVGLGITAVSLILHVLFHVLNANVKRDFAKCFVTSAFIPLTVATFFKTIEVVMGIMYEDQLGLGPAIVEHSFTVAMTASFVTAMLGMICFLFMSAVTLCNRSVAPMEDSWTVYLTAQLLGWLLSCSYHLTAADFRTLPNIVIVVAMWIALVITLIAIITGLISFALCGKKKVMQDSNDPVIYDAKHRLIWAVAFVVMIIPAVVGLLLYTCELMNKTPSSADYSIDAAIDDYYNNRLLQFFAGPSMILTVFMLPTYRNSVMCIISKLKPGKGKKNKKKDQKAPLLGHAQVHPTPPNPASDPQKQAHPQPVAPPAAQNLDNLSPQNQTALAVPVVNAQAEYPKLVDVPLSPYQPNGGQVGFGNGFVQIPPNYHATVVHTAPQTNNAVVNYVNT